MLPNNFGSYIIQPSCECQIPSDRDKAQAISKYPAFMFHIYTSFDGQLVLRDIFNILKKIIIYIQYVVFCKTFARLNGIKSTGS